MLKEYKETNDDELIKKIKKRLIRFNNILQLQDPFLSWNMADEKGMSV